ncbi:hypothetical protein O0L34_g14494 [Tuta absoluta]|nr:hypothetical protein O0L34_g14494 [Tuta absoluta]
MAQNPHQEEDQLACELQNNITAPPKGLYCPGVFDTWRCWPHTPANTIAYAQCPDFIYGFRSDLQAHKVCTENGTWFTHPETGNPWSNYTGCVSAEDDVNDVIVVTETGYAISLVALIISLGILFYFKSLRCARITVHMNLFASFALNNVLWLIWYPLVLGSVPTLDTNPVWCRALNVALKYALLTNYTWMLCEGVYLHTVLVSAFVSERRLVRVLLVAGWLLPMPVAAIYAGRRAHNAKEDVACWMEETSPLELVILVGTAVLLNVGFLCNIVRVLCTKLRAGGGPAGAQRPSATALHALRATCLLAPLLGLQYLLTPIRPTYEDLPSNWFRVYEYVSALTTSLQGLCVAVLYCFCNGEVLAQLRRKWRVLTFRPRANSTTNTTVSFVRSAAPGANEDKV